MKEKQRAETPRPEKKSKDHVKDYKWGEKKRDTKFNDKRGVKQADGSVSFTDKGGKHHEKREGGKPKFNKDHKGGLKPTMKHGNFEVAKQDTPKPMGLSRRQKQKVSDLIKNLRILYNKLMMKKKEVNNDEKHTLVDEAIAQIQNKFADLILKHDGCRLLQALLKYGNRPQRILVADKIKSLFATMLTSKYAHYLASKLYQYAPLPEQK